MEKISGIDAVISHRAEMRAYLSLAAVAGISAITIGAFGAHALKDTLAERGTHSIWATASLYHLIHAPAMLAASLCLPSRPSSTAWLKASQLLWVAGITLFSGSLYLLALGGPRWLGPVTPIGGLLLIAGWAALLGVAAPPNRSASNG